MRSKEIILKQKLNIMRNQLETLEDYAQLGFQKIFRALQDQLQFDTYGVALK